MSHNPISASHFRTLADGRHFTADELRDAFAGGFRDLDRWRALAHFGRKRCVRCWGVLKKLASSEKPVPCLDECSEGPYDPVLATLRLLVECYLRPATFNHLRPTLRHWFAHSRHHELGFLRLMLETSRQHAFEQPATGIATARATRGRLARRPFEDEISPAWDDLKTLARVYLGDEHRAGGDHDPAARQFAAAKPLLRKGGDPELGATLLELRAELAQAGGQYAMALGLLDQALQLAGRVEIEGRKAETLIRQGLARLRASDDHGAGAAFRRALAAMPPGRMLRLRLETHQYLALAELRCRRLDATGKHLAAVRVLEAGHGTPLQHAQRLWIEGLAHIENELYSAAEEALRESLRHFRTLGLTLDAAQVLASLGRLYAITKKPEKLDELERDFQPLLEAPATRRWVLALREKVVRWAEESGHCLPSGSRLPTELDDDGKGWVN